MTTIVDILDEFFSPFSKEKLWVMGENDNYTKIVRKWKPVIDSENRIKYNLQANCPSWSRLYRTNPTWRPTKTDSPKPGAFRDFVPSPPGTDPKTCEKALAIYLASKVEEAPFSIFLPGIQTSTLYTASIGSFNIYATVDNIDCKKKTATIDYWMYNKMSEHSFGRFASATEFKLSGMKSQYMWWNWRESVEWMSGTMIVVKKSHGTMTW